jgi:hypothetical protein
MGRLRIIAMIAMVAVFSEISLGHAEATVEEVKQAVLQELQLQNKPSFNPSITNPAMGLVLDSVFGHTTQNQGHFDFRSAELNLSAAIDPFANLYGVFNGTRDGVQVEEAFFMTTSLPWNMTIRGGRMFANFGRLPHWHDHELPFVNRVSSLNNFIGAEAQADGLELMHLFKTPFFLQGTLGMYNKIGADNNRLTETNGPGHSSGRPFPEFTYLGRLASYLPMGDDYGLDLGVSESLTPKQRYVNGTRVDNVHSARSLSGVDLTFRWLPLTNNVYRKLTWGTEVFRNNELRQTSTDPDPTLDTYGRKTALGGYSYVEWRFSPWWSAGPFFDYAENLDTPSTNTKTYGTVLNLFTSEFARFRLQLYRAQPNNGSKMDDQVFLQVFVTIGSHVHIFKDR